MRFVQPVLFAVAALVLLNGCSESSHQHPTQSHDSHAPAVQPQAQGHDEHAPGRDHGHDAAHALTLNDGNKWETDEALRHAMGSILTLVEPHLHAAASADDLAHLAHGVHGPIDLRRGWVMQTRCLDARSLGPTPVPQVAPAWLTRGRPRAVV